MIVGFAVSDRVSARQAHAGQRDTPARRVGHRSFFRVPQLNYLFRLSRYIITRVAYYAQGKRPSPTPTSATAFARGTSGGETRYHSPQGFESRNY